MKLKLKVTYLKVKHSIVHKHNKPIIKRHVSRWPRIVL